VSLRRPGPGEVETRIAHMADGELVVVRNGKGKHAGHSGVIRLILRGAVDLVIGGCNGLANAVSTLPFKDSRRRGMISTAD